MLITAFFVPGLSACREACATPGNGNITVECGNMGKAQQELQKAIADIKCQVTNYNDYQNSQNKKRAINATCLVPKEQVTGFMNRLAGLGEVQSQSYYNNQGEYDLAAKEKKLATFQKYLGKLLASGSPDPDVVTLISQQVQSLEYEVARLKGQDPNMATVSVQLKEKGYDRQPLEIFGKYQLIKTALIALAVLLLSLGVLLGLLFHKYAFKKSKTV
jgi:hypothetical protein